MFRVAQDQQHNKDWIDTLIDQGIPLAGAAAGAFLGSGAGPMGALAGAQAGYGLGTTGAGLVSPHQQNRGAQVEKGLGMGLQGGLNYMGIAGNKPWEGLVTDQQGGPAQAKPVGQDPAKPIYEPAYLKRKTIGSL